jgi:hypothetical protein
VLQELLMGAHIFEVVGSAVLLREERFAGVKLTSLAAMAFGRIGAVEIGNMPIANVAEPDIKSAF